MIISTVSGDKLYINDYIKNLFLETGTYHLVALSGSNIVIVLWFLKVFKRKGSLSNLSMITLVLSLYFLYTNFIHPLARATIFMILHELINYSGIKSSFVKRIVILSLCSIYLSYWADFSISMLLSIYFSFVIICFGFFRDKFLRGMGLFIQHTFFSLHMAILSIPIYAFVFKETYKPVFLLSNFIVVPIFELFLYPFYVIYLIALSGLLYFIPYPFFSLLELLLFILGTYFNLFVN